MSCRARAPSPSLACLACPLPHDRFLEILDHRSPPLDSIDRPRALAPPRPPPPAPSEFFRATYSIRTLDWPPTLRFDSDTHPRSPLDLRPRPCSPAAAVAAVCWPPGEGTTSTKTRPRPEAPLLPPFALSPQPQQQPHHFSPPCFFFFDSPWTPKKGCRRPFFCLKFVERARLCQQQQHTSLGRVWALFFPPPPPHPPWYNNASLVSRERANGRPGEPAASPSFEGGGRGAPPTPDRSRRSRSID